MYEARAIANAILEEAAQRGVADITPMKLQKLVYFAHGWNLAIANKPLVTEPIQAWKFGPVIYSLYRAFKRYGNQVISDPATDIGYSEGTFSVRTPNLTHEDEARGLLRRILDVYGQYSAIQLSNLTHEDGTPWDQIDKQFGGDIPPGINIPNDLIRSYFQSQLQVDE